MLAGKVRNASRGQHAAPLLPQYIWTRDFSQTSKHGRERMTGPVATHEPYLPAGVAWDTVSQQSPGGWGVQESFASLMERDRLLACTSSRRRLPTQLCLHFSRSDAGGTSQARAEDGRRQHEARVGWPAAAIVVLSPTQLSTEHERAPGRAGNHPKSPPAKCGPHSASRYFYNLSSKY